MTMTNIYIVREMPHGSGVFPQVFTSRSAAKRQYDQQSMRISEKVQTLELIQHTIIGTPKTIAAKAMEIASVALGSYIALAKDSLNEPIHESDCIASKTNSSSEEATT